MKVKNKPTLSSIKKKAWIIFSKYIRVRDCIQTTGCASFGLCVTCDKRYHIKLLQAGHFISGGHNANLFSEKGTHAQCYNCNVNLRGNLLEYRRRIISMYGVRYDEELEKQSKVAMKLTISDLQDVINFYTRKIKELEG